MGGSFSSFALAVPRRRRGGRAVGVQADRRAAAGPGPLRLTRRLGRVLAVPAPRRLIRPQRPHRGAGPVQEHRTDSEVPDPGPGGHEHVKELKPWVRVVITVWVLSVREFPITGILGNPSPIAK